MDLFVVRHGKAEREGPGGDSTRPLRPKGERQATWLGELMADAVDGCRIVSSRYVRAHQTAELIAAAMGAAIEFDARLELGPVSEGIEVISDHQDADVLAIVGHQPQLCGIIAFLTEGPGASGGMIPLRTGEAYRINVPTGGSLAGTASIVDCVRMD